VSESARTAKKRGQNSDGQERLVQSSAKQKSEGATQKSKRIKREIGQAEGKVRAEPGAHPARATQAADSRQQERCRQGWCLKRHRQGRQAGRVQECGMDVSFCLFLVTVSCSLLAARMSSSFPQPTAQLVAGLCSYPAVQPCIKTTGAGWRAAGAQRAGLLAAPEDSSNLCRTSCDMQTYRAPFTRLSRHKHDQAHRDAEPHILTTSATQPHPQSQGLIRMSSRTDRRTSHVEQFAVHSQFQPVCCIVLARGGCFCACACACARRMQVREVHR
jgi:hypothetical protein